MKAARIIVLGVAIVAAGGAAIVATNLASTPPPLPVEFAIAEPEVPAIPTVKVLVATGNLPVGARLAPEDMEWRDWPEEGIGEGFIVEDAAPEAMAELEGSVVRLVTFSGEPMRRAKLVGADERYMSSVLSPGKRAMAIELSPDNGAGGFILPNDRVDVLAAIAVPSEFTDESETSVTIQTVLSNVRVLAIDQTITEDEEGGKTRIGETATLEVTGKEAEQLAYVRETADTISLVLRAAADLDEAPGAAFLRRPAQNVTLIQNGTLRVQSSQGLK